MRNKLLILASLLIVASMVLGACATPTPQTVVQTVEVVKTQEVMVQGTPMVVTATPPPPAAAKEFKSKDPNTYVYVTFGEPETLDPALDYETSGGGVNQNVYETLVFYNKEKPAEFVPMLAEKYDLSADGKTYTFTLRKGVKFHNGDEMTASDVAYSFQRGMLQGGTASPQWLMTEAFFGPSVDDVTQLVDDTGALMDDPAGLQKADPAKLKEACQKVVDAVVADDAAGTVTMNLAGPWGPFLPTIANTWGSVMDKKWVVENKGWDGSCDTWQNFYGVTSDTDPFTSIANGTGAFKLDHWTKGQEIVLTRNDDYWVKEPLWEGGPTGPAKLQQVIIKKVDEWGTRFSMFQAGDADYVEVNPDAYTQIDPLVGEKCVYNNETQTFDACAPTDKPDGPARMYIGVPRTTRTDVFFNFKINVEGGNPLVGSGKLDGNGIPPDFFSDIHVRKAFNYCFDWDTYIKDALVGEAVQSIGIPIPGMPGYDPNGPKYTYDPAKCEEEFKASTLKSDSGASLWDTGFRMQVAYNTGNTVRQTVAEILANTLSTVNEKFLIETIGLPWPTFLKDQRAQVLPLFISGWQEDIHDPHNWYQPYLYGTYGLRQSMPADSVALFKDLAQQGVSETDPAKRSEIYAKLNQDVYDLAPDIILAVPTARRYFQRWVQGWFYNPIFPEQYFYPIFKQ